MMTYRGLALLCSLAPLSACGMTFGVDAVEVVTDVELEPGDATTFALLDTGVDDGVTVCGGNDTVAAHITTVEWRGDGTAAPAAAELVRVGDTIELALGGGDETVTLTRIDAEIPSDLATVAHITSGTLELCDLAAPVEASVVDGSATLTDIAAPATIDARSVRVDNLPPIDLVATGEVSGTLAAGGSVLASGTVTLTQTSLELDALDIDTDSSSSESFVTLYLPPGGDWTIYIESASGIGLIDVGDVYYDSTQEDAPPVAEGIQVDVGAGGPRVTITADAAGIFVREDVVSD